MFKTDETTSSEQRRQYTRKNLETNDLRNPSLKCNALQFIKVFEERHLKTAPKPISQHLSSYNNDYKGEWRDQGGESYSIVLPSSIKNLDKLTIDRTKPGYAKYLDTSATSNQLDYIPYSFEQQRGIGAHDNITYWTWIKNCTYANKNVWPITQKSYHPNKCIKRQNEFQILQNSVPNSGRTTETKANYMAPKPVLN